jgi:dicarboxylate transporter 10
MGPERSGVVMCEARWELNNPPLLVIYLCRFGVYDALKERASRTLPPGQKNLPAWKMGLCASAAGAVGGVAGNWADVLLVRMTSDVLKPKEQRFGYSNALSGVAVMAREEGVGSLFRGIVPNVTRAVLMNASQLATYDLFKTALLDSGYYKEGTWLHFSSSFLAGTVATTVCSPADVIKARIMAADGGAAAVVDKLRQSVRQEGIGFLFRGWSPAWIRLSPNVSHAEKVDEVGVEESYTTSSF